MKTLVITLIVLLSVILNLFAQESETVTVTLEVSVSKYNNGSIILAMYDSEESYMKDIYRSAEVAVQNRKAIIVFNTLKKGKYAFTLFHDLNENKKLDTNFFGIPKEPYGFSNEKKGRFGPPKFNEVSFCLNKNKKFKISIE